MIFENWRSIDAHDTHSLEFDRWNAAECAYTKQGIFEIVTIPKKMENIC